MKELGRQIRQARISGNLTLDDLHRKTKISVQILETIEDGKPTQLPQVHFRSFIRMIAREVGLDGDTLLKECDERLNASDEDRLLFPGRKDRKKQFNFLNRYFKKIFIGSLVLLLIVIIAYYIHNGSQLFSEPDIGRLTINPVHPSIDSDSTLKKPFDVKIEALQKTNITIRIDSLNFETIGLNRGEIKALSIDDSLFVRIRGADAALLSIENQILEWDEKIPGIDLWIRYGKVVRRLAHDK